MNNVIKLTSFYNVLLLMMFCDNVYAADPFSNNAGGSSQPFTEQEYQVKPVGNDSFINEPLDSYEDMELRAAPGGGSGLGEYNTPVSDMGIIEIVLFIALFFSLDLVKKIQEETKSTEN